MELRQLEAFSYVVETGSFSQAAKLLHVSQPTVSAHVTALERELGLTLIARTTREAGPTEAGRLLFEYAGRILALRRQADEELRRFATELSGTVTVAASTIPGRYFLPRMLAAFQKRLEAHGLTATVRRSLGGDIDASCGQLRRKAMEEQKGE